ncbi:MAG TPA: 2-hydroxychromene-2-carboxylate isomerase [Allosphingosinicella sp.]|nr:2-hydroxychromene-2-carboxylate isomerase [Allosphingosinicella sp.]
MSGGPIEFWFDFSSAYAYFAEPEVQAVAARHGRGVAWRPFMIGAAFRATGSRGLSRTPLKSDYALRDWQRIARLRGRPFRLPPHHPSVALPAVRACHWLEREAADRVGPFAAAVLRAYFEEGIDTADPGAVAALAATLGLPSDEIAAANADPEIKELARQRSDEAVARGIFGSPWLVVDGEPFWGCDRITMADLWLERGGW